MKTGRGHEKLQFQNEGAIKNLREEIEGYEKTLVPMKKYLKIPFSPWYCFVNVLSSCNFLD